MDFEQWDGLSVAGFWVGFEDGNPETASRGWRQATIRRYS
jgi:hypothetical protein